MLYQLSYFRITGAKINAFILTAKFCTRFFSYVTEILPPSGRLDDKEREYYLPNKAFSASSIAEKLKDAITSSIKAVICSLQRFPMLPSCV